MPSYTELPKMAQSPCTGPQEQQEPDGVPNDEETWPQGTICRKDGDDDGAHGKQEVWNRSKNHEVERQLTLDVFDDRSDRKQPQHNPTGEGSGIQIQCSTHCTSLATER